MQTKVSKKTKSRVVIHANTWILLAGVVFGICIGVGGIYGFSSSFKKGELLTKMVHNNSMETLINYDQMHLAYQREGQLGLSKLFERATRNYLASRPPILGKPGDAEEASWGDQIVAKVETYTTQITTWFSEQLN